MQMASGDAPYVIHWAYMTRLTPAGIQPTDAGTLRSRQWRWLLGTRWALTDTELLDAEMTVEAVQAICISGGSAFGLDAATGVQSWLAENGRGFAVGDAIVPIVPAAILFDLLNGGDKKWGRFPPYRSEHRPERVGVHLGDGGAAEKPATCLSFKLDCRFC